jgi:hypothetical protein
MIVELFNSFLPRDKKDENPHCCIQGCSRRIISLSQLIDPGDFRFRRPWILWIADAL